MNQNVFTFLTGNMSFDEEPAPKDEIPFDVEFPDAYPAKPCGQPLDPAAEPASAPDSKEERISSLTDALNTRSSKLCTGEWKPPVPAPASGTAPAEQALEAPAPEPAPAPCRKMQAPPPLPRMDRPKKTYTQMSLKGILSKIQKQCAPAVIQTFGKGNHILVIPPRATVELMQMLDYGFWSPVNVYELQFVGEVHVFQEGDHYIHVVTHFIRVYSLDRGRTHSTVCAGGDNTALKFVEKEEEIFHKFEAKYNTDANGYTVDPFVHYGPTIRAFHGHIHSDLGVFFSPTDRNSNYSAANFPAITFVCDPIRKQMKAMVGMEGEDVKIIAFMPPSCVEKKAAKRSAAPVSEPASAPADEPAQDTQFSADMLRGMTVEQQLDLLSKISSNLFRLDGASGFTKIGHNMDGDLVVRLRMKLPL